jgi:hypothetical protein
MGNQGPIGGNSGLPYWATYPTVWTGYNPVTEYPNPPAGQDLWVDMIHDFPYWNSNLLVKLQVTAIDGTLVGGVSIAEMYITYEFNTSEGKTVRQLLAGEQGTVGIVNNYVNTILGGLFPVNLMSGYLPLTTDYVVMDSYNATMTNGYGGVNPDFAVTEIPYLKFPYEDCLTALQDIIKYESALQFLDNSVGYHWMVDVNGNLLVAPVNNHHVWGVDTDHYVDSIWETNIC